MNFATAMKLGSMMGSLLGEATQNKYLKAASQAFAGFGAAAGGAASMQAGTANAANKTTPSGTPVQPGKHPVAPPPPVKPDLASQTPFKPDMQDKTPAQKQQLTKAVNQQNAWIKQQQAPQAELLKVNPGGYTKESGLQESYLKGLEQSGAKLDNKGQIVKQSGQAFKKPGWDRKAQLMGGRRTPDRLHKLRMLAIDRANIGATDVKASPNTMDISEPQTSRQETSKPTSKPTAIIPTSEPWTAKPMKVVGTDESGKPKTAAQIDREIDAAQNLMDNKVTKQDRRRFEELKSRRDLTQKEQEELGWLASKIIPKPQGRLYIKDFDKGWK